MLSLGKLCHHAAFLRDAPPHSDDDVAAGPAPTAPPVPGVLLAVDASEREEWRAVGVAAADDEHYLLRMQEKLPWLCKAGGAAAPAEALLESLLATAASPALCAERHVSQEEVLKLSLDVAHKSAWRLGDSARGRAARSERLVRVLAAAANADGQAWLHLSSRLRSISETGLRKALLEGGTAEHAAGDPRPLLLWSLLAWEADKRAGGGGGSREVVSLHGPLLGELLAALGRVDDTALRSTLQRAQTEAEAAAAEAREGGGEAAPLGEESGEWMVVEA